jgi:hypothetical protein
MLSRAWAWSRVAANVPEHEEPLEAAREWFAEFVAAVPG